MECRCSQLSSDGHSWQRGYGAMVKRIPGCECDRDFPHPSTLEAKRMEAAKGKMMPCCGPNAGRGAAVWSQHHRWHLSALTAATEGRRLRTAPGFHSHTETKHQPATQHSQQQTEEPPPAELGARDNVTLINLTWYKIRHLPDCPWEYCQRS